MKLAELRQKIDRIDRDIVRLLNERTKHALQIGRIKQADDIPVFTPGREREVVERLHDLNRGPLPDASLKHIYREIMSAARAIEGGLAIACTASSLAAARSKFGDSVRYVRCPSPVAAKRAVGNGAQLAVLPSQSKNGNAIDEFENDGKKFAVLAVKK